MKTQRNYGFLLIIILLFLVGCEKEKPYNYVNEELGFRLQLPESWDGKYRVQTDGDVANIYYLLDGSEEYLFKISRYPGMTINAEDLARLDGNEKILQQEYEVTFTANYPFKLNESDRGKEPSPYLESMVRQIPGILDSFSSDLASQAKKSSKKTGSLYYECEIPNYYQVVKSDTELMTWNFTLKDKVVGKVSFIPYGSGIKNEHNEKVFIEYKKDFNLRREVRVALLKEYISQMNFLLMMDSFKFLPGPENAMDYLSTIRSSISSSGEVIYGKILSVEMGSDKVKAIKYQRIYETSESKGKSKIPEGVFDFPISENAVVVPLNPPEYKRFGTYLYYSDPKSYFSTDEFENYPSKLFYLAVDGGNTVRGISAVEEKSENKE